MKALTANKKAAGGEPNGFTELTHSTTNTSHFSGTQNPRHLRVIVALMAAGGDVRRERIDEVAGASNGPEVIAELRRRGLHVPCDRLDAIDRDGKPCKPGVYWLTSDDFRMLGAWIETNPLGVSNG